MKRFLFIFILIFFYSASYAQHNEIEKVKDVYLKSGEIYTGRIIEKDSKGLFKLLDNNGKMHVFHMIEVDHISDAKLNKKSDKVTKNTMMLNAFVNVNASENNDKRKAVEKTHTLNAYQSFEQFTSEYVKGLRIGLGGVFPDVSYALTQIGLYSYIPIQQTQFSFIPEIDLGIAIKSSNLNFALNLAPMFRYAIINTQFCFDIGPDLYFRFYDGGIKTRLGILVGGNYKFTSHINGGVRLGYYNGIYSGVSCAYDF